MKQDPIYAKLNEDTVSALDGEIDSTIQSAYLATFYEADKGWSLFR